MFLDAFKEILGQGVSMQFEPLLEVLGGIFLVCGIFFFADFLKQIIFYKARR